MSHKRGRFNLLSGPASNMRLKGRPRWYKIGSSGCPSKINLFTVYNILQYKSNEKSILNGGNDFIDNGIGLFIQRWTPFSEFLGGDEIQFPSVFGGDNKFYNVLINTEREESPTTHPEKYSEFTPASQSLGLITDTHDPLSSRIGSTFRNLHVENFIVLNNQGETDFYKKNQKNTLDTIQNLGTIDIFRDPNEVAKTEIKLFDDSGSSTLMEYLLIHFQKKKCQNGWLYIEIDEPEITGTIKNDHFLYFWIWEGNVNEEKIAGQVDITIDNQFNQNVQLDKVGTTNPDINVLSNAHDEIGSFIDPIRIQAVMKLSEIQSGNDNKKLTVGLNTAVFRGKNTHYTIMIGLRPADLKDIEKIERQKPEADFADPTKPEDEQFTYNNPDVGNVILKLSNYRVKLETNTAKRWDDRPIPSHLDGAMNAAGIIGKGVAENNWLNQNVYEIHRLKANNDRLDFPSQGVDHFGLPNFLEDREDIFGGVLGPNTSFATTVHPKRGVRTIFDGNTNLAKDALQTTGRGNGLSHIGHENVVDSKLRGNILMLGAFKKEFFGTLNDWILRMPQVRGVNTALAVYGAPIDSENGWQHTGWTAKTGIKVGVYRSDKLTFVPLLFGSHGEPFDSDGRINIRELRTNMTLIKEFNIEDFHSNPKSPINNGSPDFPRATDDTKVAPVSDLFDTTDMHRYINVDLNLGDDTNEPIAYFWLVIGSKSDNTGFFFNDADKGNRPSDETKEEDNFPYFQIGVTLRYMNIVGTSSNPAAIGIAADLGTMLYKVPRFIDIAADAEPRNYAYSPDPNIDPF